MHRRNLLAGILALPFAGATSAPASVSAEAEMLAFYKAEFSAAFAGMEAQLLTQAEPWDTFARIACETLNKIADRALAMSADGTFDEIFPALVNGRV